MNWHLCYIIRSMKTCPFFVNGPMYQTMLARRQHYAVKNLGCLNSLHIREVDTNSVQAGDYVMLPRISFQAILKYSRIDDKRITMKDRFDRDWSVYNTCADDLLPAMNKGVVETWCTIVKKGAMYGIVVDMKRPLALSIAQDEDVPYMLEHAQDLNLLVPYFQKLAV